jgi:outer membrane protein OmpA-like peptidoglycan-associated protein
MRKLSFISLSLLALVPAASAEPRRIELGVTFGGHAFSENTELGVADHMSEPGATSSGLLGLRVAMPLKKRFAVEAEAVMIPTEDDVLGDEAWVYGLRAHARVDLLTGKIKPFVVAGIGAHIVRSDSPQMDNDTDRAYHWGAGARYSISDTLDLRLDARHLIVPDRTKDGATSDYEVTAGVTYRFGKPKPTPIFVAPPPAPGDRDGDGLTDNNDKCVTNPEDMDAFEDADGCPDIDNDRDAIADVKDACPNEAEIKNNWKDDDGCPDKVIEELAGIGFELDSAKIDVMSAPLLERAVEILKDNPTLSIEISGHTSAEGNPERNLSLSLRRAEAVKAYLVKRGVADTRVHTVGHGADVPVADNKTEEGRTKNRRIEFRILLPEEMK